MIEAVEVLVSIIRLVLIAGLCWGAWLCVSPELFPDRQPRPQAVERVATLILLVLLLTTLGGVLHAA